MALSLSVGCRDGLANTQGFGELFSGGTLQILTGVAPGVEAGVTGAMLLTVTSISFSSAGTGSVELDTAGGSVLSTGTAGYFRLNVADDDPEVNAAGTAIRAEGTCGVIEGSCELLLTGLAMTASDYMTISGNFNITA